LCAVFSHDETTFFLVDKVSPLIERKQQDCFPDLLMLDFEGIFEKKKATTLFNFQCNNVARQVERKRPKMLSVLLDL